jgi:hypothetical protein
LFQLNTDKKKTYKVPETLQVRSETTLSAALSPDSGSSDLLCFSLTHTKKDLQGFGNLAGKVWEITLSGFRTLKGLMTHNLLGD